MSTQTNNSGDYIYPAVVPFPERCNQRMAAMDAEIQLLRTIVKWLLKEHAPSANTLAFLRMLEGAEHVHRDEKQ